MIAAGLMSGGCAMQWSLPGAAPRGEPAPLTTASIPRPAATPAAPTPPAAGADFVLGEADLAFARLALGEALGDRRAGASVPWENPHSATRGTVTPIAEAFTEGGALCRPVLVSAVRADRERWFAADACRRPGEAWTMRDIKPWRTS